MDVIYLNLSEASTLIPQNVLASNSGCYGPDEWMAEVGVLKTKANRKQTKRLDGWAQDQEVVLSGTHSTAGQ